MTELETVLDRFAAASDRGPFGYANCHHHDGGKHDFHVVIGAIVHGNEVGSLPSVVELIESLNSGAATFGGRLTIFLGNPEASAQDRRFLEADLNRVFIDEPPDCHEGNRAREIKPILDAANLFVDLHQTILATDRPFYIFPFDTNSWHWARAIGGASTWVTRAPTASFSAGTCGTDEYVRRNGTPGLTLELGEKGFGPETEDRATKALSLLLSTAEAVAENPSALSALAEAKPELTFVQTVWRQPFEDPSMKLRPGLTNFQPVTEGELLSADGTPPIKAPQDGLLLFPKYPDYDDNDLVVEPRPGEIVNLAEPMTQHPTTVWG